MDPARFVFLDETGTATNMARRYGSCGRDRRLVAAMPYGFWRTTTFVAGLRQTEIIAPLVLDGPMTGTALRAYVEQFLAPALEAGDVVVLDNLAAHKVDGVRQTIRRRRRRAPLSAALQPGSRAPFGRQHGWSRPAERRSPQPAPSRIRFQDAGARVARRR